MGAITTHHRFTQIDCYISLIKRQLTEVYIQQFIYEFAKRLAFPTQNVKCGDEASTSLPTSLHSLALVWNTLSSPSALTHLLVRLNSSKRGERQPAADPLKADSGPVHRRMTKSKCSRGRPASWLKFPQHKTLFVRLLFILPRNEAGGGGGRRVSIPHDAFIVFQPNTHQAPQQPLPLYNGPKQK